MAVIRGLSASWDQASVGAESAATDPASRLRLVVTGMTFSSLFQAFGTH
jgi:hypothetical protein